MDFGDDFSSGGDSSSGHDGHSHGGSHDHGYTSGSGDWFDSGKSDIPPHHHHTHDHRHHPHDHNNNYFDNDLFPYIPPHASQYEAGENGIDREKTRPSKPLFRGKPFSRDTLKQSWQQSGTMAKAGFVAGFAVGGMTALHGIKRLADNMRKQDIVDLENLEMNHPSQPSQESRIKQIRIGAAEITIGAVMIAGTALGFTHKVRQAQAVPSTGQSI